MKNNRVKKLMTSAVILLAGLAFAMSSYAQESNTQEKVRLMIAAVQAKDSGDLYGAKAKLEELLEIVPSDKSIQSLLASVNDSIASEEARSAAEMQAANAVAQARIAEGMQASYEPSASMQSTEGLSDEEIAEATAMAEAVMAEVSMAQVGEESLLNQALLRQQKTVLAVYTLIDESDELSRSGNLSEATVRLDDAKSKLEVLGTESPEINEAKSALKEAYASLSSLRAKNAAKAGRYSEAKAYAQEYSARTASASDADFLLDNINTLSEDPYHNNLESVSPEYVLRQKEISTLMKKGKIQYLYGDYDGARRTFRNIETLDNQNMQAKTYLSLISTKFSEIGMKSHETTRKQMIAEVDNMWQLPQVYQGDTAAESTGVVISPIAEKLNNIIIEEVNFDNIPLSTIVNTLSALSVEYDKSDDENKGVNIAYMGRDNENAISLTLRNSPLGRILSLAAQKAGYTYEIQDDMVLVVEGETNASVLNLDTEVFSVNTTVLNSRILNIKSDSNSSGDSSDPFSSSSSSSSSGDEVSAEEKDKRLKSFFANRGVNFGTGTTISCSDSEISVTNTPKNIEKVRNILLRYLDVEQVEVEAKFMEVNQGALDMLAFNYSLTKDSEVMFQSNNRLLSSTLAQTNAGSTPTTVISPNWSTDPTTGDSMISSYSESSYAQNIPSLPSSINLASTAVDTANAILGVINGFTAEIIVSALSQEQGTDLLTAPKLTVMSGSTANIRVAQVMYYPTEFSDVQSQVSTRNSNNNNDSSSSAGVTITPGTPSNFVEALIGVEMEITPVVEEDKSITISLNPEVREFEGFMEYGGLAVAISSGTTVTVPSGFIQPVFAIRSIDTKVCVFDGATIVLGGLVREEVKTVNDGVPFLKDIPLFGTLFRSKGEARQKKNLLIFVTANRITPGGSLRNSLFSGVSASSVYQNPMVRSPGGAITRVRELDTEQE